MKKGFTLIELLVVIAIVALLASIVMASLGASRDKAKYAKVLEDYYQMQIAFNALYNDLGCWPREGAVTSCTFGATANPTIASLTSSGSLTTYLKSAPVFPFTNDGQNYRYDNDGDENLPATCASLGTWAQGVNVFVAGIEPSVYVELNTRIDKDADASTATARNCGKVKFDGTSVMDLLISPTQ